MSLSFQTLYLDLVYYTLSPFYFFHILEKKHQFPKSLFSLLSLPFSLPISVCFTSIAFLYFSLFHKSLFFSQFILSFLLILFFLLHLSIFIPCFFLFDFFNFSFCIPLFFPFFILLSFYQILCSWTWNILPQNTRLKSLVNHNLELYKIILISTDKAPPCKQKYNSIY